MNRGTDLTRHKVGAFITSYTTPNSQASRGISTPSSHALGVEKALLLPQQTDRQCRPRQGSHLCPVSPLESDKGPGWGQQSPPRQRPGHSHLGLSYMGQKLHGPSSVNQGKQSKVAVAPRAASGCYRRCHWESRLQLTLSRLGGGCRRTAERQSGNSLAVPGRAGSKQGLREDGGGVALGTPACKVAVGCGGTPDISLLAFQDPGTHTLKVLHPLNTPTLPNPEQSLPALLSYTRTILAPAQLKS